MTDYALTLPEGQVPLELTAATEGPPGIDVGSLLKRTGHVTLDVGYVNTASCTSAITYIDGDAGILRYRGYPIEQLAQHSSFVEVAYLLIYGDLPSPAELDDFTERIRTPCCTKTCGGSSTASHATRTRWPCSPPR
jgi:citrate synthase